MDYKNLFTVLPEPYILFKANTPNYTFVDVDEAHIAMTGVIRENLVGRDFFEVFPDTSQKFLETGISDLAEVFATVIKTKQPVKLDTFRYDIPGSNGTFIEKYWEPIHYPIFDAKGKVSHILQLSKDITDSQNVNDQLEEAQFSLELALDAGQIALWNWDVQKNIVTGSQNLAVFFGISNKEVKQGMPIEVFTDGIYDDDRQRVLAEIQASLDDGAPFESEYRTISRDGTIRWIIARGRLEHDTEGKLINFPGLILDITSRKQAEFNVAFLANTSKLLSSSLDYRKTIETVAGLAIPDIADWCTVTIVNDDGILEQVALAHRDAEKIDWARQYGSGRTITADDPNDASARIIRSGVPEYYPYISDEILQATAQSKEEATLVRQLELRSLVIAPLHDQDKNIGTVTLMLTGEKRRYNEADFVLAQELADRMSLAISNARLYETSVRELEHRKQLQHELRDANKDLERRVKERTAQLHDLNRDLERSNGELQNFAYVASHDLQEPLRKIQAFGDILNEEYAEVLGEGADYLQRMQAAAGRMGHLIEDLLSFSRVTSQAKEFTSVNLDDVLADVLEDLSDRISRTKGTVTTKPLPTIDGDETQLRQLLQNLIANALKFHKPNEAPLVNVTAAIKDRWVTLEVKDNGIGFDQKYTDRIFAVFQRLHGKAEYEGTGIGLAVCRKIVERHGGSIDAVSAPGKGSTFMVRLPLTSTNNLNEEGK